MTVEIGILNSNCVVLAADSAVTIGNIKVYNSSNKIFQLSKYEPVGIMTYNNASIMNVPVEEIVKMYRSKLGKRSFDTLKEYCDDFINFIDENISCNDEINQKEYLKICLNNINNEYNKITENKTDIDKLKEISLIYSTSPKTMKVYEYEDIKSKYEQDIIDYCKDVFDCEKQEVKDEIIHCVVNYLNSTLFYSYAGIAISGYGCNDLFPKMYHFFVEGILANRLKYDYCNDEVLINYQNPAVIKYFAQYDDIYTVVNGINPKFKENITDNINNAFNSFPDIINSEFKKYNEELSDTQMFMVNKICSDFNIAFCDNIENYRENKIARSMMDAVSLMSKEDLAELAEALLKIATIKRKASFDLETVGGPVDVAVITKGDGFIWINRKFYFDKSLNYNFFDRNGGN